MNRAPIARALGTQNHMRKCNLACAALATVAAMVGMPVKMTAQGLVTFISHGSAPVRTNATGLGKM